MSTGQRHVAFRNTPTPDARDGLRSARVTKVHGSSAEVIGVHTEITSYFETAQVLGRRANGKFSRSGASQLGHCGRPYYLAPSYFFPSPEEAPESQATSDEPNV